MIALGIAALALAAGTTVYSMHENKSNEEKASANLPQPMPPKPQTGGFSTAAALNATQTSQQAGSFLSPQQMGSSAISNAPNASKKNLLGQ